MFIQPTDPPPRAGITAVGSLLPEEVLSSDDLLREVARRSGLALPPRLLTQATGIVSRRVAGEGVYASTLAVGAARRALDAAGLGPLDVDLLVFASASRDLVEPATAHIVQAELGSRAHALDVTNACNSFVNGIDLARSMVLAGRARRALVVTGETPSRAVRRDPADLAELRDGFAGYTFGDAGAAVVVEAVERGGILDVDTETHSEHWEVGGSRAAGHGTRAGTRTPTSAATGTNCGVFSRRWAPPSSTGRCTGRGWTGTASPRCWCTR
ncbi:ketoacyl-ACP synthase III [Streptomyces sp. MS1.HAVA.3]|uniref:Ketoacyl-ACP synthase III n=1 Tax=Streptomyces caledonius TaxID=3134107 RepID=A0ABU8U1U2_9ACTN